MSIFQSDGEPAIKQLQKKVIESLNSQVKSRLVITSGLALHSLTHLRVLRLQMSEQYGFTWMLKHCAFLHSRYQIGQDAKSPYERAWVQRYKSAIIASGERQCSFNIKSMRIKKWSFGIWVGRDSTTGRHITLTVDGTIKTTYVRPLVESQRFKREMLSHLKGTPSDPLGSQMDFKDGFIGLPVLLEKYVT
eukprot:1234402-Amphidinium_carterae.2